MKFIFVKKKNNITIKDLLSILQITKQSLSRVLNQLVKDNYIKVSSGIDKRTKSLSLTEKGINLEKKLSNIQIEKIKSIIKNAEENDVNGFKKILYSNTYTMQKDPLVKEIKNISKKFKKWILIGSLPIKVGKKFRNRSINPRVLQTRRTQFGLDPCKLYRRR